MSHYCQPWNAGLASTSKAVAARIRRLIRSLDNELTGWVVEGPVSQDVADFRYNLVKKLREDGWTIDYGSNDRLTVKAPERKGGEPGHILALRGAIAADPLDPVPRLALADALEETGQTESAARERKTARRVARKVAGRTGKQ
jgi:uncharacterized protein (TIGR02996 family)